MPNYYHLANSKTIVNLLKTGKLSGDILQNSILCAKTALSCFLETAESLQYLFILELDIPLEISKDNEFVILDELKPQWIRKVNVSSLQGQILLNSIFKVRCPIRTATRPDLFSQIEQESRKRPQKPAQELPQKRAKTLPVLPLPVTAAVAKNKGSASDCISFERVTTYPEHIQILQTALREARQTILITSYGINLETFQSAGLYQLFADARRRKVRVYIYYNDQKDVDNGLLRFFEENDIACDLTWTHSKILAVDRNLVAAGSFNWLSTLNSNFTPSDEGSFVCRGAVCEPLIDEFWKHIKHYRNRQFANNGRVKRFERNPYNVCSVAYPLDEYNELTYLPTLDEHCGFLQEVFAQAKQRVIICSPFISSTRAYAEDITPNILRGAVTRGVNIYFVCSTFCPELNDFRNFLQSLHLPNIHIISVANMHLKTIIVDEMIIAEGSFNWLSASRNRNSDFHNHELTLLVEGPRASGLIAHFFRSRIGTVISEKIGLPHPNSSLSANRLQPVPSKTL